MRAAPRGVGGAHVVVACDADTLAAANELAEELRTGCAKLTVEVLPCGGRVAAHDRAALASHALLLLSKDCFKADSSVCGVLDAWAGHGERAYPRLHMLMDDVWHAGHEDGFAHYTRTLPKDFEGGAVAGKEVPSPFNACIVKPLQREAGARARMLVELFDAMGCVEVGSAGMFAPPPLPTHFSDAACASVVAAIVVALRGGEGMVAVGGSGGAGKSVATAAAAKELLANFQDVLWVPIGRSAGKHTLKQLLGRLLQEVGVSGAEGDADALASRVAGALAEQRVLVVFDDAAGSVSAGSGASVVSSAHFSTLLAAVPRTGAS
jgi:hypothetical protein